MQRLRSALRGVRASEAAPMTAAEAYAAAAAEGPAAALRQFDRLQARGEAERHAPEPYVAQPHGGRQEYQGMFATAEEAALAVARFLADLRVVGREAARAAAPAAAPWRLARRR